jgi:hypothetical protein
VNLEAQHRRLGSPIAKRIEVCAAREKIMSAVTENPTTSEFEGEIHDFVRKDVAPWRRRSERSDSSAERKADNVSTLVQRVAGNSISEIDNMIEELCTMREFLRSEGERVQREIGGYAAVSETAAASMKVIGESMAQWHRR